MTESKWRLIELYPEFNNKDLYKKFQEIGIEKFDPVIEGFVNAELHDNQLKLFEHMAFVHDKSLLNR